MNEDIRLSILAPDDRPLPADRHYQPIVRKPGQAPITFGRSGSNPANLWCGHYEWLSGVAGEILHEDGSWWLLNPSADGGTKIALRFLSEDGRLDLIVRAGAGAPLPRMNGRIFIANQQWTVDPVVLLVQSGLPAPERVQHALVATWPSRNTVPVAPPLSRFEQRDRILEALAIATWPRRRGTGYRLLSLRETADVLGLKESTLGKTLAPYRTYLEDRFGYLFSGGANAKTNFEELCNFAIDNGAIDPELDARLAAVYGELEVPQADR